MNFITKYLSFKRTSTWIFAIWLALQTSCAVRSTLVGRDGNEPHENDPRYQPITVYDDDGSSSYSSSSSSRPRSFGK